jgi:hypothetical protein
MKQKTKLYVTLYIILSTLVGCTPLTIEEKEAICKKECLSDGWEYGTFVWVNFCNCYNSTIIINDTIYINKTDYIKEDCICNITSSKERELDLIRRLRYLEGQTDKYWNDSECHFELNKTKKRLGKCENELCDYWNSSWC